MDGKTKRCSPIGKNEYFRTMVHQAVATQTNHFFGALCGYIKLEMLKQQTKLNHFALRAKLYTRALRVAFDALAELQPVRLAA